MNNLRIDNDCGFREYEEDEEEERGGNKRKYISVFGTSTGGMGRDGYKGGEEQTPKYPYQQQSHEQSVTDLNQISAPCLSDITCNITLEPL